MALGFVNFLNRFYRRSQIRAWNLWSPILYWLYHIALMQSNSNNNQPFIIWTSYSPRWEWTSDRYESDCIINYDLSFSQKITLSGISLVLRLMKFEFFSSAGSISSQIASNCCLLTPVVSFKYSVKWKHMDYMTDRILYCLLEIRGPATGIWFENSEFSLILVRHEVLKKIC